MLLIKIFGLHQREIDTNIIIFQISNMKNMVF